MKIISYIGRKIKTFLVNILEMFAFNSIYIEISLIVSILIWFSIFSYKPYTTYLSSFISLSYISGWIYQIYKQKYRIEELEELVTKLSKHSDLDKAAYIKEDLADLMHDIWAQDIANLSNPTSEELIRGGTLYINLSEEDKQINRYKAQQVFNIFNHYYNLEESNSD